MRILMVCKGNICRSPMAEAILLEKVRASAQLKLDAISVDSAGTHGYHIGEHYDHRTLSTLKQHGIQFDGCARGFQQSDFDDYDWIFVADNDNLRDLSRQFDYSPERHPHVKRMTACSKFHANQPVPDPYYGDLQDFERVYALLDESLSELSMALASNELRGKHA